MLAVREVESRMIERALVAITYKCKSGQSSSCCSKRFNELQRTIVGFGFNFRVGLCFLMVGVIGFSEFSKRRHRHASIYLYIYIHEAG